MDELQKALKENEKKIVSRGYGDGTGERGSFVWNAETRELEPYEAKRKQVDAPFVQGDEIPPTMSMTGTDRIYTSKSALRREYKELGFVETGGDHLGAKPPKIDKEKRALEIREDVAKALNDLRWGNVPVSEREREICLREERRLQGATRIR